MGTRIVSNKNDNNIVISDIQQQLTITKSFFETIKLGDDDRQKYFSLLMFQEIILLCDNCLEILKNSQNNISGIPTLVRRIFEITVDQAFNCIDNQHYKRISLYSKEQDSILYAELLELEDSQDKKNIENKLQVLKNEIKSLKNDGICSYSIKEKLKKMSELDPDGLDSNKKLYLMYRRLSGDSHSNIRAMRSKYNEEKNTLIPKYTHHNFLIYANFISQTIFFNLNNLQSLFENINIELLNSIQSISQKVEKALRDYELNRE